MDEFCYCRHQFGGGSDVFTQVFPIEFFHLESSIVVSPASTMTKAPLLNVDFVTTQEVFRTP
jgi:hypothetical protein